MSERRASLANRIVIGTAAIALATGLLTGLPLVFAARSMLEADLAERASAGAEMLAASLDVGEVDAASVGDEAARVALSDRLTDLAEEADVGLASLVDADGRVIASTDPSLHAGDADPIAVAAAWDLPRLADQDAATSPVVVAPDGRHLVSAVAPVEDAARSVFISVRAPATWSRRMRQLDVGIALAMGVWVLAVAAVGALVARGIVTPLRRLGDAVRTVAAGGQRQGLPHTGYAELDALADEFERMDSALATRERWLRALAGTVAHEVRNPAQALRLHLGLLRRELGDGSRGRLDTLDAELDLLEVTVTSLLAFAEGAPAHRERIDLQRLIADVAPGIVVRAEGEAKVDPVLLGRAVSNLVRNARTAGARSIEVVAIRAPTGLRIEVRDDGGGFDPSLVASAFEPFSRGPGNGSGLGMALVAAVARAHGGFATIDAPGPGGTVVAMTLAEA